MHFKEIGEKGGVGQVGIDFVGLASGAPSNEFVNEGGHPRPPIVFLEQGDGAEVSAMGPGKRFMDIFDESVVGGLRNIKT